MITRRSLGKWALISLLGWMIGCSQSAPDGKESKTLKVAAVLPLTGPNASLGQETSNAAKLLVKQWNETNRIAGYTLEYMAEDDASDPKQAVAAATRVVGDPAVLGVVAHFNSGCLLPASKVYNRAGVMAISPAATNPEVTLQGFPQIARVCSNDNVQGKAAAKFLAKRGLKQVAIIHDKTQYGEGLGKVLQGEGATEGLTIQSFDGISVGEKDFKALLTKIKAQNPSAIYFGGLHEEAAFLVRQMKELELTAQFVSDDGVYGQDFIRNSAEAGDGSIVSFPSTPLEKLPNAGEFFRAYEAEYKTPVVNWGPYGHDATLILLESIQKAVGDKGPESLREKVVKYARSGDHKGLLGDLKFDQNGDPINQQFSFYQVKGGKFEYLETISRAESP